MSEQNQQPEVAAEEQQEAVLQIQRIYVKDVSFEVNEGEVVTLIGANGAGKTSILRTISGTCDKPLATRLRLKH